MSRILENATSDLLMALHAKFEGKKPESRASSRAELQQRIRDMESALRKYIVAGHSPTAIAKELAPEGTRKPTWETVRRVMIKELGLTKRKRGKRTKNASENGDADDRGNEGRNGRQGDNSNEQPGEQKATQSPAAPTEQKRQPHPQASAQRSASKPGDWSAALEMP